MSSRIVLLAARLARLRRRHLLALRRALGGDLGWWAQRTRLPVGLVPEARRVELAAEDLERRAEKLAERVRTLGFVVCEPEEFPGLRDLAEPPLLLFVKGGGLENPRRLAVVGARAASGYGLRMARKLGRELGEEGVCVISGLARGIDHAAHLGALDGGGPTVAVLGAGPDRPYPAEHGPLLERIAERGAVVTEYLPGTPPKPGNFPRRNRLLVALADGLLVVEAREKGGTLTSVGWALDLGREVLVLPGPVDGELGQGAVRLLRDGATPVGSTGDVAESLGWGELFPRAPAAPGCRSGGETLRAGEGRLLALLEGGGLDLDEIVRLAGEAPGRILQELLSLELRGFVRRRPDQAFERVRADDRDAEAVP